MTSFSRRALFAASALAAPFLAGACSQNSLLAAVDALTPDSDSRRVDGAAFGPDPRQKLDLYAPPGARNSPAVLFLYGGSWSTGERASYRFVAEALVARGLVVGIADYRLAPAARYPAYVQDSALACRWMADNAARFGADPRRLALLGHSAGGMNALQLALDARHLREVGMAPHDLYSVVGLAPPTGAEVARSRRLAPLFAAADPPGSAWPYVLAATGAATAPPLTLVVGAEDGVVRPDEVKALGRALEAAGGQVETIVLPDAGHAGVLADLWLGNVRADAWLARLTVRA